MHNGCILKAKVGSGKSITSIAYYYKVNGGDIDSPKYSRMKDPPLNLCIITTAKKRNEKEWDDELARFHMSSDKKLNTYKNTIVIDSWNNVQKYKQCRGWFFIFDEDRATGSGAWAKSFMHIAKHNKWILLSATPGDVWTDYIPVFVANGFYKNKTDFSNQHIIYDPYVTKFPKIKGFFNEQKLRRLRDMIEVDIDYTSKTVRHDRYIECYYDRLLYIDTTKNRWNYLKDKPIENVSELCALWRRITNNPEMRVEQLKIMLGSPNASPKIIVFYNFDYELVELEKLDGYLGYKVAEYNGHKHEEIPDTEKWLFLVNYGAGAEGWNCTETDTIIFFSQTYSWKKLEQSKGRIDRRNTKFHDLFYYHFYSRSPLDKAIMMKLKQKKDFNMKNYAKKVLT